MARSRLGLTRRSMRSFRAQCDPGALARPRTRRLHGHARKNRAKSCPPEEEASGVTQQVQSATPDAVPPDLALRTVRQESQVILRMTRVIANPIAGSAIGAPAATAMALATTPSETNPSMRA